MNTCKRCVRETTKENYCSKICEILDKLFKAAHHDRGVFLPSRECDYIILEFQQLNRLLREYGFMHDETKFL